MATPGPENMPPKSTPLAPRWGSGARRHPAVLTLEDNVATGGFGSAVSEALAPLGIPVTIMAVPDSFIEQGGQSELLKRLGLDAQGVAARVRQTAGELGSTPQRATQPRGSVQQAMANTQSPDTASG